MFVRQVALALLPCCPLITQAQSAGNDLPLPRLKDVGMVVKVRHEFVPKKPRRLIRLRDTQSVFIIAPDGCVQTQYLCSEDNCLGKEVYQCQDGQLLRKSTYNTLDRHPPFATITAHSHRLIAEESWTYQNGKAETLRNFAGPAKTLTREVRYAYDALGRVISQRLSYPPQHLVFFPRRPDFIRYDYRGDSVYRFEYEKGALKDSLGYIERRNKAGLLTERWQISKDKQHFERERYQYDSSGRLVVYEYASDRPSLKRDGTVLRADRVEYTYDAEGRPDEERYFSHGIKRWAYQYNYVKPRAPVQ